MAEWDTRLTQNQLSARACGFDSHRRHMRGYFRKTPISENKELQSYVIGLALGDGNLSNPNKRAVRLRITCDAKYPSLVQKIKNSLQLLFPKNKASVSNRKNNYYNVSVYSNRLKEIIPWKTGNGPKFEQMASIPDWIKTNNNYKIKRFGTEYGGWNIPTNTLTKDSICYKPYFPQKPTFDQLTFHSPSL